MKPLLHVLVYELGHLKHANLLLSTKNTSKLLVGVDHPSVLRVLQVVLLDVDPELFDDLGSR